VILARPEPRATSISCGRTIDRIVELAKVRIPKRFGLDPIRSIQVPSLMNRGGVGARSLNIELQAALNPAGDRKVERFGWTFAPGVR
jgi:exodeoxyribonuclease V alpha subunit